MLTKEDLLVCSTPPNIKDVSLELYKEFAEEYLIGKVNGTVNVQMDYIVYKKLNNVRPTGITQNGINVGIRKENDVYVPLTILISKHSDVEEYIKQEDLKIVKSLEIKDEDGNVIDAVSYEFILQE